MSTDELPKPLNWDELYQGRFLKASDLKGKKVTLTISAVDLEKLESDGKEKIKGVVSFEKTDKNLALNKTNGLCLKAMFDRAVQSWVGKRITLYEDTFFDPKTKRKEPCIRIWGSPDIAEEMAVEIHLPRKKPFVMTMHAATAATAPAAKGG